MRVLVVCTNYNSYDKVSQYLNSINKAASLEEVEVDVLIGDNSDPIENIVDSYENISVYQVCSYQNLGYFGGIKFAIKEHAPSFDKYDYCIMSNVDLVIKKDFFEILKLKMYSPEVGCIAPKIFSIDSGEDRNPKMIRRPSKLKLQVLKMMYSVPVAFWFYAKYIRKNRRQQVYESMLQIYAPHGSFMIFAKSFFDFVKDFEYRAFMFCEEIFIAENVKNKRLSTIYDPDLIVIDSDHESTKKVKRNKLYKWNVEALGVVIKDYF